MKWALLVALGVSCAGHGNTRLTGPIQSIRSAHFELRFEPPFTLQDASVLAWHAESLVPQIEARLDASAPEFRIEVLDRDHIGRHRCFPAGVVYRDMPVILLARQTLVSPSAVTRYLAHELGHVISRSYELPYLIDEAVAQQMEVEFLLPDERKAAVAEFGEKEFDLERLRRLTQEEVSRLSEPERIEISKESFALGRQLGYQSLLQIDWSSDAACCHAALPDGKSTR